MLRKIALFCFAAIFFLVAVISVIAYFGERSDVERRERERDAFGVDYERAGCAVRIPPAGPNVFLYGGVGGSALLLSVVFGVWGVRWRDPLEDATESELLDAALRSTASAGRFAGIVLMFLGAPIAAVPFLDSESGPGATAGLVGLSACAVLLGAWVWWKAARRGGMGELRELLFERPEELIWVYRRKVLINGVEQWNIVFHTLFGKEHLLAVPVRLEQVWRAALSRMPHAIQGFTPENYAAYQARRAKPPQGF